MKEKLINKRTITYGDEFLAEMEICYILTEAEPEIHSGRKYGVRLIKETIENGARVYEDNTTALLFCNYQEALEFLNMLVKYEVTPIALESVVDDYFFGRKETVKVMTA